MQLGPRRFTAADQERFARFSGDVNPMHMDPVAARRSQAGAQAVHGVHVLLWALDAAAEAGYGLDRLRTVGADFSRFTHLDAPVSLALQTSGADGAASLVARQGGIPTMRVQLRTGAGPRPPRPEAVPAPTTVPTAPDEPDLETLEGRQGPIPVPGGAAAAALFPHAAAALGAGTVAEIGALSALVGMIVPGLHSIFSGLELDLEGGGGDLRYAVERVDPRFRLVTCSVAGPAFAGSVRAFARFPPVAPPTLAAAADAIRPGEFAGRRALVIGGSRGLGAATAKLVAAGGGSVRLTYRSGRAEAEAIRDEIAARFGADRCTILPFDADRDPGPQLEGLAAPTHAYYFATGRIAAQTAAAFDPGGFGRFIEVYVLAFARLVQALDRLRAGAALHILYPSTVFVEGRPKGMGEYAMAKAAGEILCAELARHRGLTIAAPRLPRTLTDQTATVPPRPAEDPLAVMLPLLRAERSA